MAWLYAAPKALNDKALTGSDKRNRLQRLEDMGLEPDLPPLGFGEYLLPHLFEAGPVSVEGMGPITLAHADLGWYQINMGVSFNPWEIRTLRGLSGAWLAESREAEQESRPPPYVSVESESVAHRRAKLPKYIRSFLRE